MGKGYQKPKVKEVNIIPESVHESASNRTGRAELTRVEEECARINFMQYDRTRQGYVELFELPSLLACKQKLFSLSQACGYNFADKEVDQLEDFLAQSNYNRLDYKTLLAVLTFQKEQEFMAEQDEDSDEYRKKFFLFPKWTLSWLSGADTTKKAKCRRRCWSIS